MFDVIIVGGGPVGLFLACELRLAGADPVVLERLDGPNQADKAHGLAGQVVRLLDQRGLYERCGGQSAPASAPAFFFGAMTLPLAELGDRNPLYFLQINQRDLERILNERAAELGVDLRRGYEVTAFTQTDGDVQVVARTKDGTESTFTARYLVGCDGGHSVVREQAGFAFPGVSSDNPVSRFALVGATDRIHVDAAGHPVVVGLGRLDANLHRTETGVFAFAAFDPQRPIVNTLEWEDQPAGEFPGAGPPMTLAEMEASISRVLGVSIPLTPPPPGSPTLLRRLCGRNTRLADRYRKGQVFIAGDAAHVHSASGGPGLNLGLQDAANLAWKLAATLQGWAPEDLLDTYQAERHAVGERVFMQTQAQTALMAPGGAVTALRRLFGEFLRRRENVQMIADLMAGSDVRYDMGDSHPAPEVGWFVPSIVVTTSEGPRRLAELLRHARPLLVDGNGRPHLREAVAPWQGRVRYQAVDGLDGHTAMLVRPDGYVAWAGDDATELVAALRRWFGTASVRAT
jgi:2-polyprenyl-6-methoxyphenol hydroxylase-like FAD-dependent oxidoreductase